MKIYQYNFFWTHLKLCGTKEVNNVCSNRNGIYFMFTHRWDLIKNIECLNSVCLTDDGFYSLCELGEEELKKLEDKFGERFR